MAEITEETVSAIDDVSESIPVAATWMEPVPLKYRKMRALIALGFGIILSVALVLMQLSEWPSTVPYGKPLVDFCLPIIPFAVGLLRWRGWLTRESVRKYASTIRLLSKKERFDKTAWPIVGFLVGAYLLMLGFAMGRNIAIIFLGVITIWTVTSSPLTSVLFFGEPEI